MTRWTTYRSRARATAAALLSLMALAACRTDEDAVERVDPVPTEVRREVRREPGLDVLLITVDTLRADALGSYGNRRAETPWMDRLAAAGVRAASAHAHSVLTLPSHASIFSGLYPQEHGVRDNAGFRFSSELPTLASILGRHGYRTGAFVSAFPLDSRFGLDHGFELYEDSFVDATSRPAFLEQERAGAETVALARQWLAEEDSRPTFSWVHLYEPHFPYAPPEPLASRFRDDPYSGEVAAADEVLGPLLQPILDAGESGNTLVVLTSDHGEALGEHGEATHGIFAYEGVLAAPLILYQPRLFTPGVVNAPTRHVDLLPTILDALALPVPTGLAGRSLLPAIAGEPTDPTVATYFEALSGQLNRGWAPLYGLIQEGWKYIDLPVPELYDLAADPNEKHNLATAEPHRLAALRTTLEPLRDLDRGAEASPESAEVRQRLQSLGYLGGAASGAKDHYTEEDDPKRLIELDRMQRQVTGLYESGDLEGALRLSRQLVRRRPGMRMALLDLAQLERENGDLDAAIQALRQAFALNPEDPAALALLAATLTQAGRPQEAVQLTDPHAQSAEPDVEVLLTRGLAFARLRQPRQAFATLYRARDLDPANSKVAVYLGTVFLMGGQRADARAAFEEALTLNPRTARAHSSLGIMATEEDRPEEALARWQAAVAADPKEHAKLLAVGSGLWNSGRTVAARPLLELFVGAAPGTTYSAEIARVRALLAASSGG